MGRESGSHPLSFLIGSYGLIDFSVKIAFSQQIECVGVKEFYIAALSHFIADDVKIVLPDGFVKKYSQNPVGYREKRAFVFVQIEDFSDFFQFLFLHDLLLVFMIRTSMLQNEYVLFVSIIRKF